MRLSPVTKTKSWKCPKTTFQGQDVYVSTAAHFFKIYQRTVTNWRLRVSKADETRNLYKFREISFVVSDTQIVNLKESSYNTWKHSSNSQFLSFNKVTLIHFNKTWCEEKCGSGLLISMDVGEIVVAYHIDIFLIFFVGIRERYWKTSQVILVPGRNSKLKILPVKYKPHARVHYISGIK